MTHEEIVKAFMGTIGIAPRAADTAVIEMMGATVDVTAEYLWDHWMGEPNVPTVEQVAERIQEVIK